VAVRQCALLDCEMLISLGTQLDDAFAGASELSVRDLLTASLLKIRNKRGRLVRFELNEAQREYARRCTKRNIVLKARQLGITTYIASRFFLSTITKPGTVTVQVAHDQSSAEEIFRIVHRFLENLPGKTSDSKKAAALSFVGSAINITDAIANKQIIDPDKFQGGLGKVIDGVVECLNASAWAK
jgi:hypothetical protein